MEDKRGRGGLRLVRRAAALAMALVGAWALSLTADLSGLWGALGGLGHSPDFVLGLFTWQMEATQEQPRLTGWTRLLAGQSALLDGGLAAEFLPEAPTSPEPIPLEEREEGEETLPAPPEDSQVVVHTALGKDDGSFLSSNGVYIKNTAGLEVDVAALAQASLSLPAAAKGPEILILHTHGSEAYTMWGQDVYTESDPYRTTDCNQNVVRLGAEMAEVFRQNGFSVLHDTTLFDYPTYNGAYDRSRAAAEKWLTQYPSLRLILDVHRDALVSADGVPYKLVAEENGERVAQVMLVVGSNDSGMEHPNWRANLALAVQLQLRLTREHSQLARPITLRSSRFNQHLSPGFLLLEVGGHGNTLAEAVAGARLFAQSTAQGLRELEDR